MEKIEVGTILIVNDYDGWCRGVISEVYDRFFIVRVKHNGIYTNRKYGINNLDTIDFLMKDGEPVKGKKDWFGRYTIKEA